MSTKIATAMAHGNANSVVEELVGAARGQLGGEQPSLVLAFASTSQPLEAVLPGVKAAFGDSVVLGASTAGEFVESGDAKDGTALFAVAGDFRVHAGMGRGLKADPEAAARAAVADLPASVDGYPHRTAILLLDPLAGNGEEATLITASLLGEGIRLAGGAAGDDLKMTATHVGLDGQCASDAIVVAVIFSKASLGVGVCHGHLGLSEPIRVTKAEGGTVFEVDGRPAWDVWSEATRESAAKRGVDPDALRNEDLIGYLLRYEAGLSTGSELKIRAPLSRNEDGSLNFACGIPEGAEIQITESEPSRQIDSAREAARRARAQTGGGAVAGALVFDCICRNLILGDQFGLAVKGISEELGGAPLAGFETYGEIALDVGEMSGFHNTTSVVLVFPA
jgi:methyl-accepting chemotaxis protein